MEITNFKNEPSFKNTMNQPQQQQQQLQKQQEAKQPPPSQTKPMTFSTPPPASSTSSTYHHTKTTKTTESKTQKLCNTSALLDQYQDDDDLTTNLLHAIRSWNLQRPLDAESASPPANTHHTGSSASSSSSPLMNQKNDHHDCNSTINTVNSDLDTATFSAISITSTCSTLTSNHQQQQQQQQHYSQQQSSNSSTITNGSAPSVTSNSTIHSNSAVKKTPCRGNYSSRPSGLTARILLESRSHDDDIVESPLVCNPTSCNVMNEVREYEDARGESIIMNKESSSNTYPMSPQQQQEEKQEPTIQSTPITKNTFIKKNDLDYPTQINAIEILQEAAITLGLNPQTDLEKVLPTIQKLARVVMFHVPNMEQFVDDICQLVLSHSQQSSCSNNDNLLNHHHQQQETVVRDTMISESEFETEDEEQKSDFHKKRRKKSKKKKKKRSTNAATATGGAKKSKSKKSKRENIQARKEQMDHVVNLLKQEWQPKSENHPHKTNYTSDELCTPTSTGGSTSRRALQKVNVNNFDSWDSTAVGRSDTSIARSVEDNMKSKINTSNNKSSCNNDDPSNHYESFYNNVMKKLEQSHPCNIEKAKESSQSEQEQAFAIINNLIQFENRYGNVYGRTNQQPNTTSSSSNNFDSMIQSPPQSSDIINNLFQVEASTLRRYAYHFTYLFSVRQEEIMEKMNDLYVFNHEASTMINELKRTLGLDMNCPMKKVGKAVIDILRTSGSCVVNERKVDVTVNQKKDQKQQLPVCCNLRREQPSLIGTLKEKDQLGVQQSQHHQLQQQQQRVRFNVVVEEFS